jgi:NADH-quinone oxidoreductase subunit F
MIANATVFESLKYDLLEKEKRIGTKVLVCAGTGCVAGGAMDIYSKTKALAKEFGLPCDIQMASEKEQILHIVPSGCHGFCEMGPLVRIEPEGILYIKVALDDVEEIVNKTLVEGEIVERLTYKHPVTKVSYPYEHEIPFYAKQTRIVLERCGAINPEDINEYIAVGGYSALVKVFQMPPEQVCKIISDSKLRGRGGGGFPTGRKWESVRRQNVDVKYVICNGDEGDPGAFMDRSIMEGDPHAVIEGMVIGGYASGAKFGYIYVRAEYPLAVARLQKAIDQAREYGFLGENILSSGFSFDLRINKGAGAFVCGEGSALQESIEGKRGIPRVRPPRTVERGLWGKPTLLNNVETFANVPSIMLRSAEWFVSLGTENNSGTKAFALTGNINNTGLIEVPMGVKLREIIEDIGGGVPEGRKFKAVQIGGPSGGCLTEQHMDLTIDFDSLDSAGAMMGSGGLVVMDDKACMVEVARFFMNFTQRESCGKCVPCREGTKRMFEIMEKIIDGRGSLEDIDLLEDLSETVTQGSLCGLGKSAANPILTTLRYFRDEYISHVKEKKCPAGVCKKFLTYVIDAQACKGCTKCKKVCPVQAIEGVVKQPFVIIQEKCIKCGACLEICTFNAVKEA